MAHEIMKKSEKDIHDAREVAKKTEEAAERVTPLVLLSLKLEHNIISIGIAYV
jgi:hypothetical protein